MGLYLTHDANALHWTLDGVVRDKCDLTGFFSSYSRCVEDGALVTISALGYHTAAWTIDDVAIYVSR